MKKFLIIILCLITGQLSYALDVVYPKRTSVTINSPHTFFIGSCDKPLTINGNNVNIHKSGGFAYFVDLKEGENTFILKSGEETLKYSVIRPKKMSVAYKPPQFVEYKELKNIEVAIENSPLRKTPVSAGANRMAHLPEGIKMTADGEKAGFYRVRLSDGNYGWIAKSNVKVITADIKPSKIYDFNFIDSNKYYTYVFHLERPVPFEILEGENFLINFYNIAGADKGVYSYVFPYFTVSGCKKIVGYEGHYAGNDFIFQVRKYPKINQKNPLKGITIAIDAGHGGKEVGAVGCLGNKEKDINLEISKYLESELKHRGAHVVMTRTEDNDLGLRERVNIANENDALILLSIHCNALPDHLNPLEHSGTSVYYYYNQAKLLAAHILIEMNEQLGTNNDKVRQGSLALVRNTDAVSVLIETAYMINPEDNAKLVDPEFQKQCAKAIADGIANYIK